METEYRPTAYSHSAAKESEPTFVLRTLDWVDRKLTGRHRALCMGVRSLLFLGGMVAFCAGVLMLVLPGPGLLAMLMGVGLMGTVYRRAGLFAEAVAQKARSGWWMAKEWWRRKRVSRVPNG